MSRKHIEKFLKSNRHLMLVNGSKDEKVIRWAEEKGLVSFVVFEKTEFYTQEDLDIANMWAIKEQMGVDVNS